jgi:predicted ester cyclase
VDHDPAQGQPQGGGGLAWYWGTFEASFSDVERRIIETIATPVHVVTVMDLSGTHTGEWMGHAPTGKRFTVRNVQVIALKDGLPVNRWGSTDQLGIMQQLGLIPEQHEHPLWRSTQTTTLGKLRQAAARLSQAVGRHPVRCR